MIDGRIISIMPMESYRHRSIANKAGGHASWVVFVFSRNLGAVEEVQSRERKAKGIGSSPSVSCEPCMYAEYAIDQSIVAEQSVCPWTTCDGTVKLKL
jgi:hypothetical protein